MAVTWSCLARPFRHVSWRVRSVTLFQQLADCTFGDPFFHRSPEKGSFLSLILPPPMRQIKRTSVRPGKQKGTLMSDNTQPSARPNALRPGTAVIINDTECASESSVAVICAHNHDSDEYHALYLSSSVGQVKCVSTGTSGWPTPLREFGVMVEISRDGLYRVVPTGDPSTAIYSDGRPRQWMHDGPVWRHVKPEVFALLKSIYSFL